MAVGKLRKRREKDESRRVRIRIESNGVCSTSRSSISLPENFTLLPDIRTTHVSLEDWLMLTWSFGWTGFFEPSSPPKISMALLEMTSFTFMLV